jgi:hypothetical protein
VPARMVTPTKPRKVRTGPLCPNREAFRSELLTRR